MQQLSKVNVAVGLVVLAVMLAVNSPLLDFRKMTVADQLQRLADNEISVEAFDIQYFRRHLARPGYEALQALKTQQAETYPSLVLRINALYTKQDQQASSREEFIAAITFLSTDPPQSLITTLYKKESKNRWTMQQTQNYYLKALDVDKDGSMEYLWVQKRKDWATITLYFKHGDQWTPLNISSTWNRKDNADEFYQSLLSDDIQLEPPRWNDIVIGGKQFRVGLEE